MRLWRRILSRTPILSTCLRFLIRGARRWRERVSFFLYKRRRAENAFAYKFTPSGELESNILIESDGKIGALPDALVIHSGCYEVFDHVYDCRSAGVYRFFCAAQYNVQRVVLSEVDPVTSALLLACIACRGNKDDTLSPTKAEKKAKRSLLAMTCGPLATLIHALLEKQGLRARVVNAHTLQNLNGYNDGHALLEVWLPVEKRYVVVDVDKKSIFTDESGKPMNLFELANRVDSEGHFTIRRFPTPSTVDWSGFIDDITYFNYQFYEAWVYGSEKGFEEMVRRTCQVPVFVDNGTPYACAWSQETANKLRAIGESWTLLTPQQFADRFYSQERLMIQSKSTKI